MDNCIIVSAKYDYVSSGERELSFKKGDKFILIDDRNDWWLVQTIDMESSGYVPCNYMKTDKRNILAKIIMPRRYRKPIVHNNSAMDSEITDCNFWVTSHNYECQNSDELSLAKGIMVHVLERKADGWWYVETGNQKGWFPSNYLISKPVADSRKHTSPSLDHCWTTSPPSRGLKKKASALCGLDAQWPCVSDNSLRMCDTRQRPNVSATPNPETIDKMPLHFTVDCLHNSKSVDREMGHSLWRFRPLAEGTQLKRCNSAVHLPSGRPVSDDPFAQNQVKVYDENAICKQSVINDAEMSCDCPYSRRDTRYVRCLCSFDATNSSELNVASGELLKVITSVI